MNFLKKRAFTQGLIIASLAALLITGCGSSDSSTGLEPGSSKAGLNPASGSAASAALKYWQWLQDGDYPLLVDAYDIKVPRSLGLSNVIGASVTSHGLISDGKLIRLQSEDTSQGTLITFTFQTTSNAKKRYSYLMKRRGKRWVITYDTLLAGNLPPYVRDAILARADSPNAKLQAKANKAATAVDKRYRTLFIPKRFKLKE